MKQTIFKVMQEWVSSVLCSQQNVTWCRKLSAITHARTYIFLTAMFSYVFFHFLMINGYKNIHKITCQPTSVAFCWWERGNSVMKAVTEKKTPHSLIHWVNAGLLTFTVFEWKINGNRQQYQQYQHRALKKCQ